MATLKLEPGETILAQAQVSLAKGFPQTAGNPYLTDRREAPITQVKRVCRAILEGTAT